MANLLMGDVQELLVNGAVRPIVRKKAALALLRLLRKSPADVEDLLQSDVRPSPLTRAPPSRPVARACLPLNPPLKSCSVSEVSVLYLSERNGGCRPAARPLLTDHTDEARRDIHA